MTEIQTAKKPFKPAATPKFEMPKYDLPTMEVPEAMREFAEKGVQQAKDAYDRMKTAAEEATNMLEDTYATASKGAAEFNLKALDALRANFNASFDYMQQLMGVKTAVGSGRAFGEPRAQAVRHAHRAGQGAFLARHQGTDRHRRADQGRRLEDLQDPVSAASR